MNSMPVRHSTQATPLLSLLWPPHVSAIKPPRTTYERASEMPPSKGDSASQRAPVGDSDPCCFAGSSPHSSPSCMWYPDISSILHV
ncbi:hypothetical protein C8Q74DRAFT_80499 [Fomes fomentarius]|nr:hypothetical protein C8Q74DRAFT_80499 [Fomes fomentarius]